MMTNRKYAFLLKAKNSVEIYDFATGDEIITLDDEHIQDFIQWYFTDSPPVSSPISIPKVEALVDAASSLLEAARAEYEDTDWTVAQWVTDEPTVAVLDAALAAFKDAQ